MKLRAKQNLSLDSMGNEPLLSPKVVSVNGKRDSCGQQGNVEVSKMQMFTTSPLNISVQTFQNHSFCLPRRVNTYFFTKCSRKLLPSKFVTIFIKVSTAVSVWSSIKKMASSMLQSSAQMAIRISDIGMRQSKQRNCIQPQLTTFKALKFLGRTLDNHGLWLNIVLQDKSQTSYKLLTSLLRISLSQARIVTLF